MVESPRQEREIRSRSLAPGDAPRAGGNGGGKTRILDFLHRPHEQDGEMGGFAPQMRDLSALSSWAIFRRKFLPRWLFPFQKRSAGGADRQTGLGSGGTLLFSRCRRKKRKGKERAEEVEENRREKVASPDPETTEGINGGAGGRSLDAAVGARKPKEISFDIGMGVGMAFMLFRWATELNKIKELRIQMEMLLKEIKDEIPKKALRNEIWINWKQSKHSEQLQLELDREDSVMISERGQIEVACGITDSSESHQLGKDNNNVLLGVSASELEKRLSELIHGRQKEPIGLRTHKEEA
ncbi:hypothetical protein MUK42_33765 [Musa troglodytarum]|uniref:Uncharacterized protein n=1 Tax=Musa troglodytarum TaxID=320322 RepID=A0A9E7E8P9_9LILI|nr:hypothetical protein MUK42_33765 [Musa troglodytarum]